MRPVFVTVAYSGEGKDWAHFHNLSSVTFDDGSTTTGKSTTMPAEISEAGNACAPYLIESEQVLVTGTDVDNDQFTATRAQGGTSGVAHTAKAMTLNYPTPTIAGSPIISGPGKATFLNNGVESEMIVLEAMLNVAEGTGVRNDEFGHRTPTGQIPKGKRVVTATVKARPETDTIDPQLAAARDDTTWALLLQAGDEVGRCVAWSLPTIRYKKPAVSEIGEGAIAANFEIGAFASSGNDELVIYYF